MTTVLGEVELVETPFVHSTDPQMTGMRGVMLDAESGYRSGRVFATCFPTVFVADSGDVEFDDVRVPRDVAAAWFRAVADRLDRGADVSASASTTAADMGPFATEVDARKAIGLASWELDSHSVRSGQMLLDACTATGVELGDYDLRILSWLAGWSPTSCAVVAGLIRRAGVPS